MKSADYWRERLKLLEESQHRNASEYADMVSKTYEAATRDIEKDLAKWYTRYATEEGISLTEAKRILNTRELKEFRMDVKEYIRKGESLDPQWAAELERASVKFHVSRLEALKVQVQQAAESVKGQVSDSFDKFAVKTYSDQYYKTIFEIQKGTGVGFDVMRLDKKRVEKVIVKPWAADGRNFSERIWGDRTKLVNELHQTLSRGIIRGLSPQKMIKELSGRMGASKANTERLIHTESAFFASRAANDAYKELEVEQYEILATLDRRTSDICRSMDGKVFKRSEFNVGVNAPPFHPRCRTTTVPYFPEDEDLPEYRAARGDDGKYYTVPASMKYHEWEKAFVNGGSKEGLEPIKDVAKAILKVNEACNLFKTYGNEHYQALHTTLESNASEDMQTVWAKYENELVALNTNWNRGAHFSSVDGGIKLNLAKDSLGSNWQKPYQTSFHEFGHMIDFLAGGKDYWRYYSAKYKNGIFEKTITEEILGRIESINDILKNGYKASSNKLQYLLDKNLITKNGASLIENGYKKLTWKKQYAYSTFEKELTNIDQMVRSSLSDIAEGVTKGKVQAGFGHGKTYWERQTDGVAKEAFAEFWECVANPEQWEVLKKYLPKSTAIFEEMIKELAK